jgi:serine/threonine-protein kinase
VKVCPTCQAEYPDELRFCQNDGTTLRTTQATEIVGSIVADTYHITEKIGAGGMGTVYLGRHVKMGRLSAIKIINAANADDAETIARFNREAANAARINHHNVCSIYDFGETAGGLIYLAMEYVDGESLSDLAERESPLPLPVAADLVRQTAEALQAAHDLGIVHRDLKPDNIMITKAPDGALIAKVVDFGIAKAIGADSAQQVTKTGLVIGTPEYMSPEQLSGDTLDGRTDIYSLGLVAFRLLAGSLPFRGQSSQEVMFKRLTDDPLTLTEALPDAEFPEELQRALNRALARMPADRYSSAREFGNDVVSAVGQSAARVPAAASSPPLATAERPETREARATPHRVIAPTETATKARWNWKLLGGLATAGIAAVVVSTQLVSGNGGEPATSNPDPGRPSAPMAAQPPAIDSSAGQGSGRVEDLTETGTNRDTAPGAAQPAGPPSAAVDPVAAWTALDDLVLFVADENPGRSRDSALWYYGLEALPDTVRARAAYVVAHSHSVLNDRASARRWIDIALNLEPDRDMYTNFRDALLRNDA